MYNFSILVSDELAAGLKQKIISTNELHINNIEISDSGLCGFTGEELENWRNMLIEHNKKIVLYECSEPIGNYEHYLNLFRKAHLLNIENIKVHIRDSDGDMETIAGNLARIAAVGKSYGIRVLCENKSGTPAAFDKDITIIFRSVNNEYLGLIFNPLEFVKLKSHPFFHVFYNSKLKNHIHFLRVNDGLYADNSAVMPAEGNGEIKEMASILLARGFKGYFSFTPYLENMDMAKYREVMDRFKKLLMSM